MLICLDNQYGSTPVLSPFQSSARKGSDLISKDKSINELSEIYSSERENYKDSDNYTNSFHQTESIDEFDSKQSIKDSDSLPKFKKSDDKSKI